MTARWYCLVCGSLMRVMVGGDLECPRCDHPRKTPRKD